MYFIATNKAGQTAKRRSHSFYTHAAFYIDGTASFHKNETAARKARSNWLKVDGMWAEPVEIVAAVIA